MCNHTLRLSKRFTSKGSQVCMKCGKEFRTVR